MRKLANLSLGCFVLAILGFVYASATPAFAQGKKKAELKVKVGDTAPKFESVDENGKTFRSTDVVGKKIVVLYFYPADFTGGCTKQACGFRDDLDKLGKNVLVVGVSGDSVATHKLFSKYHKLTFPLLADEKGEIAATFGVPHTIAKGKATGIDEGGNKIDVFRSATIQRYTIVIGLDGKVAAADQISDAGGDAKRIAEIVSKLGKS
jgi:peroxiredoxin Q/BCP